MTLKEYSRMKRHDLEAKIEQMIQIIKCTPENKRAPYLKQLEIYSNRYLNTYKVYYRTKEHED
jgi:hypothetical protein